MTIREYMESQAKKGRSSLLDAWEAKAVMDEIDDLEADVAELRAENERLAKVLEAVESTKSEALTRVARMAMERPAAGAGLQADNHLLDGAMEALEAACRPASAPGGVGMDVGQATAILRDQCPSASVVLDEAAGVVLAELERLGRRHEEDRQLIHELRDKLNASRVLAKLRNTEGSLT